MPGGSAERAHEDDSSLNDSVEWLQRELSALLQSSPSNPKRISRPATRSPLKPLDTNACSPANTLRSPPRPANTPPVCDVVTSSQTETPSSHKQPRPAAFDPRASECARQKSGGLLEHALQTSNPELQQGAANVYQEILHDTACVSTSGCNTPTTTSTGAQGLSLRAPSVTPRCAERQCLAFCLAPAEPLAGLEETRQVWEREKAELNESIASARRRLEASSKELQERTLEVAALGEALAARDRALDSANEQLRKVLEHNVLLSQENKIANQEAQRVSTDRDQLAHQLAVKVEEEEREAAACMAPGDEAHQDDEVRSLRRRLAYWRARDKSRDEQREEEKEAWRRDAAAHNSQRVAQDKVVARAQEESTKLAQEVNRLSALLGEANAEARRLAAVVEQAGQQTAEMEWRLVEQVAGLEASLEKLAAAAAGSHAKHAHDTAEQERRHQLLCQQVEARMQAKSQALIDAQRRREQEAEEAASARVARVEESAEVELGHVREESRALSEAHMTIGAHLLAQITQADALLSATMALARHEEEARLRAASGARALEAAEAERHKVARSLAAESQRAEAASRQVQALQGELQQAEAKALREQLAHEASTAGLQARLEAAEAAEQEERAREIMLQERSRLVETSEHQLKAAFARLVQVEHDRDREREALTKAFEIALEKIGRLHCAGTIASVAGAGEADLSKTADTRGDSERAERIGLPGELCAAGQALVRELEKDKTLLKAQIRELQDLLAKSTAALKAASEQMVAGCQAKVAVVAPTSGNSAPRTVSAPTYSIWRPMRTPTVGSDTDAVCMRAVTCVALAEGKETSPLQATQRKVFLSPPPPPQAGTRNPAWTHVVTPSEWARAEVV